MRTEEPLKNFRHLTEVEDRPLQTPSSLRYPHGDYIKALDTYGGPATRFDEFRSVQAEIREKLDTMLAQNGYSELRLRPAVPGEYMVDLDELAILLGTVLNDLSKRAMMSKELVDVNANMNRTIEELMEKSERAQEELMRQQGIIQEMSERTEKQEQECRKKDRELQSLLDEIGFLKGRNFARTDREFHYPLQQEDPPKSIRQDRDYSKLYPRNEHQEKQEQKIIELEENNKRLKSLLSMLPSYDEWLNMQKELKTYKTRGPIMPPRIRSETVPAQAVASPVLQEICDLVKVSTPEEALEAIKKITQVLKAVPRMESFIKSVVSLVQNHMGSDYLSSSRPQS